MDNAFSRLKGNVIASGIISIILGILFLLNPIISGFTLCYFIGAMILVGGIIKMVMSFSQTYDASSSFVGGLLAFFLGLLCIIRPDIIWDFLTILAGIFVIADGAKGFSDGVICMRAKVGGGVVLIIASILLMICGVFLMFMPFTFIMVMAGIVLLVNGIFSLIFIAAFSDRVEEAKHTLNDDKMA